MLLVLVGCSGKLSAPEHDGLGAGDAGDWSGDPRDAPHSEDRSDGAPSSNGTDSSEPGSPEPSGPAGPGASNEPPETPGAEPDPEGSPATPPTPAQSGAGVGAFSRLTRAEYRATVSGALGVAPDVGALPDDGRIGPFTSNVNIHPDPVHPYMLAAEALAQSLVPTLLPACGGTAATECLEQGWREPLGRLYRRPLGDAELAEWAQLITELEQEGVSAEQATRTMLAAVLTGPDFLFRAAFGGSDVNVSARRIAERISYVLWDEPPDAELSTHPGGSLGELSAWLVDQALRLSHDERAVAVLSRFLGQWLEVDTDLRLEDATFEGSPEYLELLAFTRYAVQNQVPVTSIVSGNYGFVHRDQQSSYGLEGLRGFDDSGVARVEWPEGSARRGLLAGELLASSTRHPDASRRVIFRGLLVRRGLLCDTIPTPSADLVALAAEVGDRTEDARCAGCHLMIDPIGGAFAALDPGGEPVAAQVLGHRELEGSYPGLAELLEAVAGSRAFAECFSKHWLEFFLEQPMSQLDPTWVGLLADAVEGGASLTDVVRLSVGELAVRSDTVVPWCSVE